MKKISCTGRVKSEVELSQGARKILRKRNERKADWIAHV